MRIIDCEWDDWNIDHIQQHGVEPDEVEEALTNRPFFRKAREGKHFAFGQTDSGRYLTVIFAHRGQGRAYPISARDSNEKERSYARSQKK